MVLISIKNKRLIILVQSFLEKISQRFNKDAAKDINTWWSQASNATA